MPVCTIAERLVGGFTATAQGGSGAGLLSLDVKIGDDRERTVLEYADDVDVGWAFGVATVVPFVGDGAGRATGSASAVSLAS